LLIVYVNVTVSPTSIDVLFAFIVILLGASPEGRGALGLIKAFGSVEVTGVFTP